MHGGGDLISLCFPIIWESAISRQLLGPTFFHFSQLNSFVTDWQILSHDVFSLSDQCVLGRGIVVHVILHVFLSTLRKPKKRHD